MTISPRPARRSGLGRREGRRRADPALRRCLEDFREEAGRDRDARRASSETAGRDRSLCTNPCRQSGLEKRYRATVPFCRLCECLRQVVGLLLLKCRWPSVYRCAPRGSAADGRFWFPPLDVGHRLSISDSVTAHLCSFARPDPPAFGFRFYSRSRLGSFADSRERVFRLTVNLEFSPAGST